MAHSIKGDLERLLRAQGAQVKARRELRLLTLAELAERAGVGVMTVVRIEAGSPGVSLLNLHKVLHALDMPQLPAVAILPAADSLPRQALHLDSDSSQAAIEEAARAACEVLDEWLGCSHPERDGISGNFQGQLSDHLAAMLCGLSGSPTPTKLKRLVYSDDFVGGPAACDDPQCRGWALRLHQTANVVGDSASGDVQDIQDARFDPYSTRRDALRGLRDYVERHGHPGGRVDAVPVFLDEQERYCF